MDWYGFQFNTDMLLISIVRLLIACFLGGVIGFEREYSKHKPAGFRTHILVSLGSCLVVLISHFASLAYGGFANVDPTRIGAQVVSGIGFLGAGAIIRHGASVKGITTAASVWAVACVGLACGYGFFTGAVAATVLIWAVLMYLKVVEDRLAFKEKIRLVEVEAKAENQILFPLNVIFKDLGLVIKSLEVTENQATQMQRVICHLECKNKVFDYTLISSKIKEIEGVLRVSL